MHVRHVSLLAAASPRCLGVALLGLALLGGCGDKLDKPSTQAAAKVNKEELTVHQINAVLARQRTPSSEQADVAARRALEGLIDQELALQKSAELRLDRDPRVVQAIEAMRREVIARAYVEKIGEGAGVPTAEEIKKYYIENPALFRDRRIYRLQEFSVQASPEQASALQERLRAAKPPVDIVQLLRAGDLKFTSSQSVRAAEQVPLDRLQQLANLKDGEAMIVPAAGSISVLQVIASRPQPIDEVRATVAIEQFLLNDRKRKLVSQDLKALRAAAKIEYLGAFATGVRPSGEAALAIPDAVSSVASGPADKDEAIPGSGAMAASSASAIPGTATVEHAASAKKGLGQK
jgi:EpsD family peptidyl-prolyl cis-trans isomerase